MVVLGFLGFPLFGFVFRSQEGMVKEGVQATLDKQFGCDFGSKAFGGGAWADGRYGIGSCGR